MFVQSLPESLLYFAQANAEHKKPQVSNAQQTGVHELVLYKSGESWRGLTILLFFASH